MKPLLLVLGGILVMTETLSGSRARTCPRGYVVCDGYLECDDSIDELPCGLTESIGYEYYYTSTVQVPGSQDKSLTISANVRFEVQKKNRINMVVFDAPKNVGADEDWKKTFVLMRGDDGRYDHIISNPTTSPVVLNIKKAMASVFQVTEPKGRNEYSVVETDVSGTCAQDYRVETSAEPFHHYLANRMETGIPKTITKTNDYSECSERPAQTRNYLETEDCSPERGSRIPMSKTITSCQVYLDAKGSLTIAQCITNETHAIPQAPDQGGNLNAIHVSKRLSFRKLVLLSTRIREGYLPSLENMEKSSLLFKFGEKRYEGNMEKVEQILRDLSSDFMPGKEAYQLHSIEAPTLYVKLIGKLRDLNAAEFDTVYTRHFDDPKYRQWLEDALPFIGTAQAVEHFRKRLEDKSIETSCAIRHLSRLGSINRRTESDFMDNVMTLCSSPRVASEWHLHTNCWLAFGSLVYTHSKDVGKCPDKYCKALRDEYKKYIHDEVFHERDPKHMESLVVALKAIGNSGRVEMLPEVLQVIKNWESLNPPIIEAIEALRRMTISGNQLTQVRAALLNYFVNMGFCPEIRMVAFVALMDTSPPPAIISRLVQAIQDEKVPIVKQYVFTTLDKDSKFNCKTSERKKQAQSLLGRLLFHKKSRYQSFVYGLNIGEPDSVFSGLEYDETHTPLSSLPRHIRMKNFFGFLGYVAEHMELKIRQDEVMPLFRDLIGPYGTWLDKNSVMDIMRPKRSAAKDGFPDVYHRMKEKLRPEERRGKPFKLTMSAKLFGSEIVYLLLNNSMDAIKSLEEDGTIKLDKDWLGNQLKAGMNLNMNATDVLVDTMKRLPTTAGLPLTYQLTNGGVFRYNAYLQLTTSPLHNLIPWGRVAEETEGTFRECFSVVNNQMIKAYVSAGDSKMGFKFSTYGAFRCPVPFDEVKFETKGRDGKFIRKVVLDVEMNKQNTSFAKTGSEFHFFTYDKNGYWSKEMSKNRPPRLPGPLPGMGPETGQRLGQEGDGLGRLIGMFGGRGSPMGGNHPHPPGEPMGGRGGSSSGPNGAGRGPAHSRRRQIHNGGIPGTSGSGPRAQGMGPQEGVRDASPIVCREAWNDSLALCMDNSKNTHMWFYPGGRPVENINLEYKNSTDADEPYWKYELEIEVDDAGRKHLDKYDIKIRVPRPPSSPPPSRAHSSRPSSHREVISIEAMRILKPRSILPDGRTPKNPEWTACVQLGMNPKERQLQVHAGMGQKDCSVYSVNMSVGYTEKNADPGIDIAISWNSLPDNLEMMTCPAKQIMKQMGKVPGGGQGWGQPPPGAGQGGGPPPPGAGQGGGPPPPGAGQGWGQPPPGAGQGGGPPPPGAGQGWGQPPPGAGQGWGQPPPGAGQGGPPPPGAGQEGPPPPGAGQGGGPPPPGAGQGWGLPPPGSGLHLYCFTSFNLSLVMANGTKLQVFGVPTPETLVFEKEMPFFKPIHNKLKGFVKYETCNAIRATDEITTFDKKQFTYRPTTGCPHVLAKDCSKKELFTVFMNVTAESKKELTVVVKDRKGIGHVFVITPEMTVMHDGSPLQMKPIPGEASTSAHHIPRLCKVTKSAEEVVVTCDAGLTVITNAEAIQVKVSPWYFHYMCGMCGNFDWRPTDDSRDPVQRVQDLDHAFAASWLVPGENCKSGCKVVQRPLKEVISGKYCVATNALQCAPGCQATRSTNTTLPFACVDQSSPLVAETDKNFRDENFGAILNAFKDKVKSAKYSTIVHYDCNCDKCPLK